jgi:hypothetical protein
LGAYATVVLAGTLEEAGYSGRILATAGDVLIHPTMDCHANQMVSAGVKLIRLDWPDTSAVGGLYHLDSIDELARTAERTRILDVANPLWLPSEVNVHIRFHGVEFQNKHRYTNYQRFRVSSRIPTP